MLLCVHLPLSACTVSQVTGVIGAAVGISVGFVAQATDIIGGIANEVKSAVFRAMREGSSSSRKKIVNSPANGEVHEPKPTDAATISTTHTSVQDLEDFGAKYTSSYDVKSSESKKEDYDEFLKFMKQ
jgi:hypothetical protein